MAKMKPTNNINSFSGLNFNTSSTEQASEQESNRTHEEKYTPKKRTPVEEIKKKKKGRPKLNREIKKRYSFTIFPSLYDQASELSRMNGVSLSELIEGFFVEYIKRNS